MSKIVDIMKTKTIDDRMALEFVKEDGSLHAYNIEYFLEHPIEAITLQLDNLILTYGVELVTHILNTKQPQKKVG